jgi:hypothetical protein
MSAGDVDGDGFGDLVVGNPREVVGGLMGAGCVRLFRGSAAGIESAPSSSFCGAETGGLVGIAVAGVGDVNGDGYADVAVGAPGASPAGMSGAGAVLLFYGSRTNWSAMPSRTLIGASGGTLAGSSIGPSIDVNADRLSDLVIGNMNNGGIEGGNATIWHGAIAGVGATPTLTITSPSTGDLLGGSTSTGDFNGDGYGDIAIGSPGIARPGFVDVYHGGATGIPASAVIRLRKASTTFFAFSMASPGDTNRDGFDDLIIGEATNAPGGLSGAGSALVFRGSASGLPAMASQTIDGTVMRANFGIAVGGSGDFNGDGFADVVIGAHGASPGGRLVAGTAAVYAGSASTLTLSTTIEGASAMDGFGTAVALRTPRAPRSVYQARACFDAR